MSNVLSDEKKQQVIALGKLGWPLRRIEQATGVRRETVGSYLKAEGIVINPPGWRRRSRSKPAIQVATDSGGAKPANEGKVTPDFIRPFSEKQPLQLPPPRTRSSSCEPFREIIELGLSRDRNAMAIWQSAQPVQKWQHMSIEADQHVPTLRERRVGQYTRLGPSAMKCYVGS